MCIQLRFKSVCPSAQSDQSLSFRTEETWDPWLPIDCPSKTLIRLCEIANVQVDLSLRWDYMPTCTFWWTAAQMAFVVNG